MYNTDLPCLNRKDSQNRLYLEIPLLWDKIKSMKGELTYLWKVMYLLMYLKYLLPL